MLKFLSAAKFLREKMEVLLVLIGSLSVLNQKTWEKVCKTEWLDSAN